MTAEKQAVRKSIYNTLTAMKAENTAAMQTLRDSISLTDYAHLVRVTEHGCIWTAALQTALDEHEIVVIPASDEVYFIDDTVVIPANRHNTAFGATVRQTARRFGISKSTVHKDVTMRLEEIDPHLAAQVRSVLNLNKSERHIRGGMATKAKYLKIAHKETSAAEPIITLSTCTNDDEHEHFIVHAVKNNT